MIKTNPEYIVLGRGGLGGGATYWLARQAGREVLGLEQFQLGHPHGASQDHPQILVCTGAGHAYRFASPLGKIISELAIDGRTDYPIEPFTMRRAAITDPNYPLDFGVDWLPATGTYRRRRLSRKSHDVYDR